MYDCRGFAHRRVKDEIDEVRGSRDRRNALETGDGRHDNGTVELPDFSRKEGRVLSSTDMRSKTQVLQFKLASKISQ